jgi:hypothetical protein
MEFKIYNLRKLCDVIEYVFRACKKEYNTAVTAEKYFALETAEKIIYMHLYNVHVEYNKEIYIEFFRDHPFKSLEIFTPTVDPIDNSVNFTMMLNGYWYWTNIDLNTRVLTFPHSKRKNHEQIKEYFIRKLDTLSTYTVIGEKK